MLPPVPRHQTLGYHPGNDAICLPYRGAFRRPMLETTGHVPRRHWISDIMAHRPRLVGLALLVRLPGFDGRALFIDELWRALMILSPQFLHNYVAPSVESAITSPIYAVMVKSAAAVTISPDSLRMPSLLCGLLACPLAYALTRKAGGGILLSLLAGLFFALNGNFITYSNQMKPYIFEVCIHLVCVYAWLATISAPRPGARDWAFCFLALTLAVFSTPTSVFLLPAFGLSLFVQFLAAGDRKNLGVCILGFAGLGVVVLALYVFSWRYGANGDMLAQWAAGFQAPGQSYPAFLGSHFWRCGRRHSRSSLPSLRWPRWGWRSWWGASAGRWQMDRSRARRSATS